MRLGITAVSGKLGQTIAQKAIDVLGNEHVTGLARTPEKAAHLGIEVRPGDYNREADFVTGLSGLDVLIIISGMDKPENRVEQHRNIIRGAQKAGVQKILYNSIFGIEGKCEFDAIIRSNRQTEQDIRDSGLEYAIGRNGLYIDADLEAIPDYIKAGKIANPAGEGKCGYTSREELADAYLALIQKSELNGSVYILCGEPVTQSELADAINRVHGAQIRYEPLSIDSYFKDRRAVHGAFFGNIIGGIYEGIRNGAFDVPSDFEKATGRPHQSLTEMLKAGLR